MSHYYFLNEDHTYTPCDLMTWANQFEHGNKVANDVIKGKHVSTIWLGLDHNWWGGRPLVFETMVFDEIKGGNDIYMERYTTWDEAIAGHQKAIEWVRDGCKEE
mgnify:CR=1 FL=1